MSSLWLDRSLVRQDHEDSAIARLHVAQAANLQSADDVYDSFQIEPFQIEPFQIEAVKEETDPIRSAIPIRGNGVAVRGSAIHTTENATPLNNSDRPAVKKASKKHESTRVNLGLVMAVLLSGITGSFIAWGSGVLPTDRPDATKSSSAPWDFVTGSAAFTAMLSEIAGTKESNLDAKVEAPGSLDVNHGTGTDVSTGEVRSEDQGLAQRIGSAALELRRKKVIDLRLQNVELRERLSSLEQQLIPQSQG
ncbi:MAG: hypothetical protein AAGI88_21660 [Pseudomonadota bacterium]